MRFKISILIILIASLYIHAKSSAQNPPEIIITWQAQNYAPPGFEGKVLPIRGTNVSAAIMLIEGGKIINLSQNEIRWFVNRGLENSGIGLAEINFKLSNIAPDSISLKAEIRDYKGENLEKSIVVPLGKPELVITGYGPAKLIEAGKNTLNTLVYFFNINNLNQLLFGWSANSEKTKGESNEPDKLELDVSGAPSGATVDLNVTARNKLNELEFAEDKIELEIK